MFVAVVERWRGGVGGGSRRSDEEEAGELGRRQHHRLDLREGGTYDSCTLRKIHVCTLRKVRQGGSYDSLSLRKDARPYAFS